MVNNTETAIRELVERMVTEASEREVKDAIWFLHDYAGGSFCTVSERASLLNDLTYAREVLLGSYYKEVFAFLSGYRAALKPGEYRGSAVTRQYMKQTTMTSTFVELNGI